MSVTSQQIATVDDVCYQFHIEILLLMVVVWYRIPTRDFYLFCRFLLNM